MNKIETHLKEMYVHGISTIVRANSAERAKEIIEANIAGGITHIEVPLTIPQTGDVIKAIKSCYPAATIGAGTVMNLAEAKAMVQSGAEYIVSPIFDDATLQWCKDNDVLYCPGAFTANEIYHALTRGAQIVKLYPSSVDMNYIKALRNPWPELKLLATGGPKLDNMLDYFAAGVWAIGVTDKLGCPSQDASVSEIKRLAQDYVNQFKAVKLLRNAVK